MGIAQRGLLIFVVCILLFLTEWIPMAAAAVLGCVLMVVFDVASFSEVFGQFSSSSVILVISMMIIGDAMFQTGVAGRVGEMILSISGGNERKLLFLCVLTAAVVSAFLSNVATLSMFMAVFQNRQQKEKSLDLRNIMLPVAIACILGGSVTLVGSAPQMTTQNILTEMTGKGFRFFDYAFVGLILIIILLVYVMTVGYPLGKRIWGGREIPEEWKREETEEKTVSRHQLRMLFIFVITVILFFLEPVPLAVIGAGAAVSCIIFGCTDQRKAFQAVQWSSVTRLAGCLGIVQALKVSGGADLLSDAIFSIIGTEINAWPLFICSIVLTQVFSEFMTNGTALVIILPVVLNICNTMGYSLYPFAMGITLASSIAFSTPLSNTPLNMVGVYGYRFRDYFRYGLGLDIILAVANALLVPLFFPF
ncbi:MAG: anion permease [Lachnospiraceae bacterium]|nr:anion permease [Lachnospiraceae bacterium]